MRANIFLMNHVKIIFCQSLVVALLESCFCDVSDTMLCIEKGTKVHKYRCWFLWVHDLDLVVDT